MINVYKGGPPLEENNSKDLMNLTKRAQEILSAPSHVFKEGGDLEELSAKRKWSWHFTLLKNQENDFQNDKILTLCYFDQSGNLLDSLFLETVSCLVINKNISFLQGLAFRELENFLRDENHLPSFDNSALVLAEKSFRAVKNSLLSSLIIKELENNKEKLLDFKGQKELTLVEKNQKAQSIIALLNVLFRRGKPLELAFFDGKEMMIVMNDFPLSLEVIEELAHNFFGNMEEISSFKVVAVQ